MSSDRGVELGSSSSSSSRGGVGGKSSSATKSVAYSRVNETSSHGNSSDARFSIAGDDEVDEEDYDDDDNGEEDTEFDEVAIEEGGNNSDNRGGNSDLDDKIEEIYLHGEKPKKKSSSSSSGKKGEKKAGRTNRTSNSSNVGGNRAIRKGYRDDNMFVAIRGMFRHIWSYYPAFMDQVFFGFMKPLLNTGAQRPLKQEDLPDLHYDDSSEGIYKKFAHFWKRERSIFVQKNQGNGVCSSSTDASKKGFFQAHFSPLTRALFFAFGGPFMRAGLFKIIYDIGLFASPMIMKKFIVYLQDPTATTFSGIMLVVYLCATQLIMSLFLRQYFWWCFRVGMRLRSCIMTTVFHKSVLISSRVLMTKRSIGEINNIMSIDSTRLQDLTPYLHSVWFSVFQISIGMWLLYDQLGASSLAGVAVILLTIPLTTFMSGKVKAVQKDLSTKRDERAKLCNEILVGIKIIKYMSWEKRYYDKISSKRNEEIRFLKRYMQINTLATVVYTSIPLLVAAVTFLCFVFVAGGQLTVPIALTSLVLFELLRFPLTMFPNVVNNIAEAQVAIDRIEKYLLEEDATEFLIKNATTSSSSSSEGSRNDSLNCFKSSVVVDNKFIGVKLDNATFAWERSQKPKAQTASSSSSSSSSNSTTITIRLPPSSVPGYYENSSFISRAYDYLSFQCSTAIDIARDVYLEGYNHYDGFVRKFDFSDRDERNVDEMFAMLSSNSNPLSTLGGGGGGDASVLSTISALQFQRDVMMAQNEELEKLVKEAELKLFGCNSSSGGGVVVDSSVIGGEETAVVSVVNNGSDSANKNNNNSRILSLFRVSLSLTCKDNDMSKQQGRLLAVVGSVGSGKSTLLSSMLGETILINGSGSVGGNLALASQKVFLQNASIRNNILFGRPFDDERYWDCVYRSGLDPDLDILSKGDLTVVGDRGVTLSGGQKARVALARCLYSEAEVYLLDDPLSAVDAHVASFLFSNFISYLTKERGRLVILVTNALHYLKHADEIIVIKDGKIDEQGSFNYLTSNSNPNSKDESDSSSGCCKRTGLLAQMLKGYNEQSSSSPSPSSSSSSSSSSNSNVPTVDLLSSTTASTNDDQHQHGNKGGGVGGVGAGMIKRRVRDKADKAISPVGYETAIGDEDRAVGDVSRRVYMQWFEAAASRGRLVESLFGPCATSTSSSSCCNNSSSGGSVYESAADAEDRDGYIDVESYEFARQSFEKYKRVDVGRIGSATTSEVDIDEEGNVGGSYKNASHASSSEGSSGGVSVSEIDTREEDTFMSFVRRGGGFKVLMLLIGVNLMSEIIVVLSSMWLSYWANSFNQENGQSNGFLFFVYLLINCFVILGYFVREHYARLKSVDSSAHHFLAMTANILRSPLTFFEVNPMGRILNRFTKDVYTLDEQLPNSLRWYVGSLSKVAGVLLYIAYVTPLFVLALIPIGLRYHYAQKYYLKTSRELTRLDALSRSPIYALFSEMLEGLVTIRCFRHNGIVDGNLNDFDNSNKSSTSSSSSSSSLSPNISPSSSALKVISSTSASAWESDKDNNDVSSNSSNSGGNSSNSGGNSTFVSTASDYISRMRTSIDNNQKAYYLNFSANCWLGVRLEFTGTIIITFAALFAVFSKYEIQSNDTFINNKNGNSEFDASNSSHSSSEYSTLAALAGLSLSLALSVTQSLNWSVRMASEIESQMVSTERIRHYIDMKQEAALTLPPLDGSSSSSSNGSSSIALSNVGSPIHSSNEKSKLASSSSTSSTSWRPTEGVVSFKDVALRYRPELPLSLKKITFTTRRHEKVGICGRTGSGKSTLLTALLRLVEIESGTISIDGKDVSTVGLKDLRRGVSVIPQDPILFSGTVRSNLDPFGEYSEFDMLDMLDKTRLKSTGVSLDHSVSENGSNLSVGQRQLICISRALLAKHPIVVMDEATASVDSATDTIIQTIIRDGFSQCTVLTIAHRLNTILDSDRVIVVNEGCIAEFDEPSRLLKDNSSMFYSLVNSWETSHQNNKQ